MTAPVMVQAEPYVSMDIFLKDFLNIIFTYPSFPGARSVFRLHKLLCLLYTLLCWYVQNIYMLYHGIKRINQPCAIFLKFFVYIINML
ncbi:MAG: hypothetical protein COX19_11125 [Desulfobacterales bacterium CG23_combo_of_CG06-09_8_20_14_all_51_8]|nr:MAG: hypothetical protein COX19_11125 [Desulfobacterales bacterium CG23_combo_of_CG06-09_8_20_14_all_51_8]